MKKVLLHVLVLGILSQISYYLNPCEADDLSPPHPSPGEGCAFTKSTEEAKDLLSATTNLLEDIVKGKKTCDKAEFKENASAIKNSLDRIFPAQKFKDKDYSVCMDLEANKAMEYNNVLDILESGTLDYYDAQYAMNGRYFTCVRPEEYGDPLLPLTPEIRECLRTASVAIFSKAKVECDFYAKGNQKYAEYSKKYDEELQKKEVLKQSAQLIESNVRNMLEKSIASGCSIKNDLISMAIDVTGTIGSVTIPGVWGLTSSIVSNLLGGIIGALNSQTDPEKFLAELATRENFNSYACLYQMSQNSVLQCDELDYGRKKTVQNNDKDAIDGCIAKTQELNQRNPEITEIRSLSSSFQEIASQMKSDPEVKKQGPWAPKWDDEDWIQARDVFENSGLQSRLRSNHDSILAMVEEAKKEIQTSSDALFLEALEKVILHSDEVQSAKLASEEYNKSLLQLLSSLSSAQSSTAPGEVMDRLFSLTPSLKGAFGAIIEEENRRTLLETAQNLRKSEAESHDLKIKSLATTNSFETMAKNNQFLLKVLRPQFKDYLESKVPDTFVNWMPNVGHTSTQGITQGIDPKNFSGFVEILNACVLTSTAFHIDPDSDGIPLVNSPIQKNSHKICKVFECPQGIPKLEDKDLRSYQCKLNDRYDGIIGRFFDEFTQKGTLCGKDKNQILDELGR